MDRLLAVVEALMPNATPEERQKLVTATFRVVVLMNIVWGLGWLATAGFPGYARANEIDQKIRAAVDPINTKLDQLTTATTRILIEQVASRLRDLQRMKCGTTDPAAVDRLDAEIESAEREYKQLVGERYPLPACVK